MEYRVVVVGAGAVGKSALTVRFIQGNFIEKYDPTIEDSYRKQVEVDGQACMMDIMDTAGQEEYSALRDNYMKTGEGFLLVFSITNHSTFDTTTKLRTNILRLKEGMTDFPIVLTGNKCDLEDERLVRKDEAEAQAGQWKVPYIETSAKMNINVNEAFYKVVRQILLWRNNHPGTGGSKEKKRRCNLL